MNLPHHRNFRHWRFPNLSFSRITPDVVDSRTDVCTKSSLITRSRWEAVKWLGNICLLFGTLVMISPVVASTAITPWVLFLLGNLIWLADSIYIRSWPWVYIAGFLATWDTLIIVSRLTGTQFFSILDSLITTLSVLP